MAGVPPPRGSPGHAAAPADRAQLRHRRREPDRQPARLHPLLEVILASHWSEAVMSKHYTG